MVLVEFRAEVYSAGGVAVVEDFNPCFNGSLFVEHGERNFGFSNVNTLVATVSVEHLDVELVRKVGHVENGMLTVPGGVLATVLIDSGGPFLVANSHVDEGVHLVQDAALVVLEVSRLEMHVDVTVTGFGKYDDEDHL